MCNAGLVIFNKFGIFLGEKFFDKKKDYIFVH